MKLNHIDLQVPDVQATVLFFERYMDFELRTSRGSPALAILDDRHGAVVVLQRIKNPEQRYPEGFHIGFLVEREDTVVEFQRRAREDGLDVTDVDRNARGVMAYCHAPGGFVVEVSCRNGASSHVVKP